MGSLKTYAPIPQQTTETKSAPVQSAPKQSERQPEVPPSPAALLQLTAQGNGGNPGQHSRTLLNAQRHYGNRAVQRLINRNVPQVQRKQVNGEKCAACQPAAPSHDKQQVPDLAERVTTRGQSAGLQEEQHSPNQKDNQQDRESRSIDPPLKGGRIPLQLPIQRKTACGACAKSPSEEEEELRHSTTVQRKAADSSGSIADTVQDIDRSKGGGQPLDSGTRTFMESRFNEDFGGVRVHADHQANQWSQDLNAHAFTTGKDIFFAPGKYAPATDEGKHLLAHELTHVVQQQGGRVAADTVDTPGDRHEQEAEQIAQAILRNPMPSIREKAHPRTIQRAKASVSPGCVDAGNFVVPQEKGEKALKKYPAKAKVRLEERPSKDLQAPWLAGNEKYYKAAGIEATKENFPRDKAGKVCTVDHIREWSLYGEDDISNFMLMGGGRNFAAGGRVGGQLKPAKQLLENDENKGKTCLEFTSFSQPGVAGDDECMSIDKNLEGWLLHKAGEESPDLFNLRINKVEVPIDIQKATKQGKNYTGNVGLLLRGKREAKHKPAPGLILGQIKLPLDKGKLTADGSVEGTIIPEIVFPLTGTETPVPLVVEQSSNKVKLPNKTGYRARFPGLSDADFNFSMDGDQLEGEGTLKPTKPILNKSIVKLVVKNGKMDARLQVPVEQINLPVPGLTLGGEGFTVGFEDRKFFASGKLTLQYGTAAKGEISAQVTGGGFSASGKIDLTIPGLDKATGEVWIREDGKVGGRITVGADKLKLPGVKSANLVVTIQDGQLAGEGTVQLSVPGIKEGKLGFGVDQAGNYNITGSAQLSIPGLDEATVGLAYKNGDLEGTGKVGFKVPGLEGAGAAFELKYAKGKLTGSGQFNYKKGKLAGNVNVNLSEKHKLSGGGELSYEIAPGLVAFAGLQIKEDGTTKISGGLRVPETIDLFPEKKIEKSLFKFPHIEIPILAIPLGTRSVGIVATIDGELLARAGIGPGQLRKVKLLAEIDPSKEESAFSFHASAELYVPAFAELAVSVSGGIGVSLAIVRAVGGINAEAAAGIKAEFIAAADLKYDSGQFAVSGKVELAAQPKLIFRLNAFVKVEADLFITTIELYEKKWQLAAFEYGSNLRFGLRMPFKYVFGKPFELSLDQIEFIKPEINVTDMLKSLLPK